jgi:hypothetical protein
VLAIRLLPALASALMVLLTADMVAQLGGELPKAISGHNSYFIWGPQGCTGQVIITVNFPLQDVTGGFESVEPAGKTSCFHCMPFENNAPIMIGRGLKLPIKDAWPRVKDFE